MARYRTIKPQTFSDANLTEVSRDARLLFIGSWCFVDDMGRAQLSYRQLKNEVFPGDTDISPKDIEDWFAELVRVGVVEIYEVREGRKNVRYFRIPHFLRHQKIDKPSHTDSPAAPTEEPTQSSCLCTACKMKYRIVHPEMFPQELIEDSPNGRGTLDEQSESVRGTLRSGSNVSNVSKGEEGKDLAPFLANAKSNPQTFHDGSVSLASPNSVQDRRLESRALDEISTQLLDLLAIPSNSQILEAVRESIRVKTKAENCTIELAAHKIAARAALVKKESPPESWFFWFRDARYDYVPEGDKRLSQRGQVVRPTCGGVQCSEGWESVLVNGERRLRRCQACAQLWKDRGLE